MMQGARVVLEVLREEGVQTIFGYPGGSIMPVYDALVGSTVHHVLTRHEQAAVHAAEGYAVASDSVGVCLSSSGPGTTNLVTGLANALADSIPVVAISGQVPSNLLGTDAFQEANSFGLMRAVVKHNFLVRRPEDLSATLRQAFQIARSGRKGPVHVDLPKNIMLADCPFRTFSNEEAELPSLPDPNDIERAVWLLSRAERPLCYAGGGIHRGNAQAEFRELVERCGCPVVTTLKGLGALPRNHRQFLGMMGMHGTVCANEALRDCDLLFVVGARFDDRATGNPQEFCPRAPVLHLDIDAAEVGKLRAADVAILGDLRDTLPALTKRVPTVNTWRERPATTPDPWLRESPCPREIIESLDADVVTTDVGQHQMWTAQHLNVGDDVRLITSGGFGTMGFGLPAAIGAQFARPDARVVCVSGDGSLMMMIHELATLRRYRLPVKIVLFNNRCLGLVRQWQEVFFDNRESEVDLSDNPDFTQVASAFGIPGRTVTRNDEVASALEEAWDTPGPFLVNCLIEREANVWPLVPPGQANHQMLQGVL